LFTCLSSIYAKPLNSEFSYYLDPSQNQQLLHQTFSTFQCGTSSHQDSFYRHQNHVQTKLHTCWILKSKERCFLIQPEDANLIDKICMDNPHKSLDTLRTSLARNPAINDIKNKRIRSHYPNVI